jgi:hypothetical protein
MSDGDYSVVECLSMTVDVVWDGVPLATGATAREQDGGWFVELEQPMPVGTSITLGGDVQATGTVTRVHEGAAGGAGMLVMGADSRPVAAADDRKGEGGEKKEKEREKEKEKEKRKKKR